MIVLKTERELAIMKAAGEISAQALQLAGELIKPGITTREVDKAVHDFIVSKEATPSFLGYSGYPASCCISIGNEVIHGIPSDRVIREGDIVSVDVGAFYRGFHGDNAATFPVGEVSSAAQALIKVTKNSLEEAIRAAQPGARIGDVSFAVSRYIEEQGYSVVRQFVGHGIGRKLHEEPEVPNFGTPGHGARLMPGMVIAIEPMINEGTFQVEIQQDGWTVLTKDRKLSAHFEHTVAITSSGPVILTAL